MSYKPRPPGDHGTGTDAIEFALNTIHDPYELMEFLKDWREGNEEMVGTDYYEWLEQVGR